MYLDSGLFRIFRSGDVSRAAPWDAVFGRMHAESGIGMRPNRG